MRNTTQLRGEILEAARGEFAQYGLAGARIDRIARNAQASKERLYAHFGDKETLFREVFAADSTEFFRAVTLRPDDVPEFVGEIYDLALRRPEHLRMINWAHLEGFMPGEPMADGQPLHEHGIRAIEEAQAAGHVDPAWQPADLMAMLFAIGLTWANLPHPDAVTDDPAVIAQRRAVAVEAAARIVTPRA